MELIANFFGYLLNFIYDFVQNYGVALILFTIVLKIIMLPISIKQQSSMKKTAKLQAEMNKIQMKYKNNPEMYNKEVMALYKREKVSPMSGCLSSILQLVLFIGVFFLVSRPLTYMKKINPEITAKYQQEIIDEGQKSSYPEIAIIAKINSQYDEVTARLDGTYVEENNQEDKQENNDETQNIVNAINNNVENTINNEVNKNDNDNTENTENKEEKKNYSEMTEEELEKEKDVLENSKINMEFLGLDLSKVPMQNWQDFKVLIIPILYVIVTFVNIKITNNMNKTKKKEEDSKIIDVDSGEGDDSKKEETQQDASESMQQMTKSMTYVMPIMSIAIAMIAPLGLSLYWLVTNCLQLVERIAVNKILDKKEEAKESK